MTKAEAKKHIWNALATTLSNDLDGTGADYIFNSGANEADTKRLEAAAREILAQLERKER